MKKLLLLLTAAIVSITTFSQVYDGITQPTRFRVLVPVTTNIDTDKLSVSPFIGYKQTFTNWFNVTGVAQYNLSTHNVSPQLWLNFNANNKLYFLMRTIYDTKPDYFRETLSATYKAWGGLHFDCTWDNFYADNTFLNNDRLQFLGGYDYKHFVVNGGYSCRYQKGWITNVRYRFDKYNWLQMKYDGGIRAYSITSIFNFNDI